MRSPDYGPGDVVTGRFSCTDRIVRETAEVTARLTEVGGRAGFIGRNWTPQAGLGMGVWGYDDEIENVTRGIFSAVRAGAGS